MSQDVPVVWQTKYDSEDISSIRSGTPSAQWSKCSRQIVPELVLGQ